MARPALAIGTAEKSVTRKGHPEVGRPCATRLRRRVVWLERTAEHRPARNAGSKRRAGPIPSVPREITRETRLVDLGGVAAEYEKDAEKDFRRGNGDTYRSRLRGHHPEIGPARIFEATTRVLEALCSRCGQVEREQRQDVRSILGDVRLAVKHEAARPTRSDIAPLENASPEQACRTASADEGGSARLLPSGPTAGRVSRICPTCAVLLATGSGQGRRWRAVDGLPGRAEADRMSGNVIRAKGRARSSTRQDGELRPDIPLTDWV